MMNNPRKMSKSENKKKKLEAFVELVGHGGRGTEESDNHECVNKKMKIDVDCDKPNGNMKIAAQDTSNPTTAITSNLDNETKALLTIVRRLKSGLKVPLMILKMAGNQASLSCHMNQRVPILFTDVQHLLINSIIGDESPYLPLRWCDLQRCGSICHTIVTVVDGLSLYDYSSRESLYTFNEKYEHQLEVVTPSLYKGSVIDELAVVPVSDLEKADLVEKYGSMAVALESRKDLMVMLKAVFPVVDGLRPALKSDKIDDEFSRAQLLLSAWQMLEDNYPIPLKGKLKSLYSDYVLTKDTYQPVTARSPMFGLDCEMCRTRKGNELTRISIIDENYKIVYEKYVLPHNEIVDYLTSFSGITKFTLQDVKTRLSDVQNDLRRLLPTDAILVGQSLNFDLHALKMMHPYVIDTSVIYNITGERRRKSKLKQLAQQFLGKTIQSGNAGHCSVEDATTSLKLVKLKLTKHLAFGDSILKRSTDVNNYNHLRTSESQLVSNIFNQVIPKKKSCLVVGSEDTVNRYKKFMKCFDNEKQQDVIKVAEFDGNESIVKHVCDSYKLYNLTLAHINVEKCQLDEEETHVATNNLLKNLWSNIESRCLSLIIFAGNELCNGVIFATVKK